MRIIVNVRQDTAGLCNGSTADSDSVCEGSNPSPAAKKKERHAKACLFFFQRNKSLAGFVKYAARVKYGFAM